MTERWETVEQLRVARERFAAGIPGWRFPFAYGVGRPDGDRVEFARINSGGEHLLPAVVLASVCGHPGGSASYRLDRAALGRAIDLLAPAEACTAYQHPNLAAWRGLRAAMGAGDTVLAVFAADPDSPCDDVGVAALRERVRADGSGRDG